MKLNINSTSETAQHELVREYANYIVRMEDNQDEPTHSNVLLQEMLLGKNERNERKPPTKFNIQ